MKEYLPSQTTFRGSWEVKERCIVGVTPIIHYYSKENGTLIYVNPSDAYIKVRLDDGSEFFWLATSCYSYIR